MRQKLCELALCDSGQFYPHQLSYKRQTQQEHKIMVAGTRLRAARDHQIILKQYIIKSLFWRGGCDESVCNWQWRDY